MDHPGIDELALRLLAAARGQLPLTGFAAWLYAQRRLPADLDPSVDERLLAIDYARPGAAAALRAVCAEVLRRHRPDLAADEAIRLLLCGLAGGAAPLIPACAQLSWHRASGAAWVPAIFAGLDSELDAAEDESAPWVQAYRELARREARRLLAARYPDAPCPDAEEE